MAIDAREQPPAGHIVLTYEDYCALPDDGKRYEIIEGELYVTPSPSRAHQQFAANLLVALKPFVADRGLGEVFIAPFDVILEERRSRIENNPSAVLDEQMNATLYLSHPYGIPVIGWEHEMAKLSREDALRFYKRHRYSVLKTIPRYYLDSIDALLMGKRL